MSLVDTHCHIHSVDYPLPKRETLAGSLEAGVEQVVCVGTDAPDSEQAVAFASGKTGVYASIGLHPHDAKLGRPPLQQLRAILEDKTSRQEVVAIGECGLDYFYQYSPKLEQEKAFRYQIEMAAEFDLPMIFHVREAFDDFWRIMKDYPEISGVVHSFSASPKELNQILEHDLLVGLNGIMTFTKDQQQLEAAKAVPLAKMVLETDAPFLTPSPLRGKVNEPRYVAKVADFLAKLRQEDFEVLCETTTANARQLFGLKQEAIQLD